jgi:flagellar hook-length control protein FliK
VQSLGAAAPSAPLRETVPIDEIVEAVSEEIEVVPSLVKGDEEVIIHLKPTVLDGSEIRMSAKEGVLTLEIAPATQEAARAVERSIPQLERALAEHVTVFHGFSVAVKKGKSDEAK